MIPTDLVQELDHTISESKHENVWETYSDCKRVVEEYELKNNKWDSGFYNSCIDYITGKLQI